MTVKMKNPMKVKQNYRSTSSHRRLSDITSTVMCPHDFSTFHIIESLQMPSAVMNHHALCTLRRRWSSRAEGQSQVVEEGCDCQGPSRRRCEERREEASHRQIRQEKVTNSYILSQCFQQHPIKPVWTRSETNAITLYLLRSKLDTDVRKIASWQVEENITEEVLDKKINELVASRGRKNTDPREVLRKLEVLSKSARPLGRNSSP